MTIEKEILSQSMGVNIKNVEGQQLGKIVEVTFDDSGEQLQYLILESNHFFSRGKRYFALPVCSKLIDVTDRNEIRIHASEDDFQFAKGIAAKNCPKPDFELGVTIYELFNYKNTAIKKPIKTE